MLDAWVVTERLGEFGELRLYRRAGPPEHLAVEVLREADGRAWTLRAPWEVRAVVRHLLADSVRRLASSGHSTDDRGGLAQLGRVLLAPGQELLSLFFEQDGQRAFALWRRELLRCGEWGWTIDLVVVPDRLAVVLCQRVLSALDRLERRVGA